MCRRYRYWAISRSWVICFGTEITPETRRTFKCSYYLEPFEPNELPRRFLTAFAAILAHSNYAPVVDMIARVSYESVEIDVPGFGSADDSGFGLGLGLRFAASEQLELNAGINYVDLGDSGDDTGFEAGGLYSFTDAFALGLSGSWGDNVSAYSVTGRFYFGQ